MTDGIDVVIPTRNEDATIRPIVEVFIEHPAIRTVIVGIDEDTTDDTMTTAIGSWLGEPRRLVIIFGGRGKGQVVKKCLQVVETPHVIFCDGDITGLSSDHIDLLIADAVFNDKETMTVGVPDIPANYPTDRVWAWPWVSGERCVPTKLVRPLELHGYLMETQINSAARHANFAVNFQWLVGLTSPYNLSEQRIAEMQRDAAWGKEHGIL